MAYFAISHAQVEDVACGIIDRYDARQNRAARHRRGHGGVGGPYRMAAAASGQEHKISAWGWFFIVLAAIWTSAFGVIAWAPGMPAFSELKHETAVVQDFDLTYNTPVALFLTQSGITVRCSTTAQHLPGEAPTAAQAWQQAWSQAPAGWGFRRWVGSKRWSWCASRATAVPARWFLRSPPAACARCR